MDFKTSSFCNEAERRKLLSESAWDFIDACADDWKIEYKIDFLYGETEYKLTMPMHGYMSGEEAEVAVTYSGSLTAICMVIEHLAHVEELLMNEWNH